MSPIRVSLAILLAPVAFVAVMLLAMFLGWAVAYADTASSSGLTLTPTDIAAWAGLVLAVVILALRVIAPRTKATWDDELLARLEALEGVVRSSPLPTSSPPVVVVVEGETPKPQ